MHSDSKAYGRKVLTIKNNNRRYEIGKYQREFLEAINIIVEIGMVELSILPYTHHLSMLKKRIIHNILKT